MLFYPVVLAFRGVSLICFRKDTAVYFRMLCRASCPIHSLGASVLRALLVKIT